MANKQEKIPMKLPNVENEQTDALEMGATGMPTELTGGENPDNRTSEEMRAELKREFEKVDNSQKAVDTDRFITKNRLKQVKIGLLNEVFDALKRLRVDPSDPESISLFLQKLEREDPDLLVLFESALAALDPEGPTGLDVPQQDGEPRPEESANMMGQFSGLQGQVANAGAEQAIPIPGQQGMPIPGQQGMPIPGQQGMPQPGEEQAVVPPAQRRQEQPPVMPMQ